MDAASNQPLLAVYAKGSERKPISGASAGGGTAA